MRVIGMSPSMFMLSVEIALQNSGWTPFDCNAVADLTGRRFVGYSVLLQSTTHNWWRRGMPTSAVEIHVPNAESVTITDDALTVALSDGRTLSVPLAWFPRLLHATLEERDKWRFIGKGQGIHWEDIDEDISIENLLAGKPSGESQTSLKKWLQSRTPQ
jgi:hypothetical protein